MVPNGWERKPLEKVAEIRTGVAKGKKGLKDPIEVPYLRVANVQDGHIDLSEVKTIKIERHQLERYSLQVGDVLMTEGGDFDKLGRGDVWQGQITPCLNQNHVFAVRPNNQILLPYFLAALSGSNYGKTYFLSCAKRSTNLASINSTQLKEFPVLLPPLPEQRKIAKILSTWDKAITTTEKLIETSKQQKKALMQQLLTGKKRLVNPETRKEFVGEWESSVLNRTCKISKGKQLNRSTLNATGQYPVINGGITPSGYTDSFNTVKNTITISEGGNSCGYIDFQKKDFWCGGHCYNLKDVTIDLKYLYQYLKFSERKIMSLRVGSGLPNIQKKAIENVPILYPSEHEQRKIASILTAADKEIEILTAKLAHFKQEKKALMQQLLTGKRRVKIEEMEVA
ncbi:restriction endonuclease subunit S [Vibrio parahaemolyticus]|uniref:restriction endonuclease subunit S n=1 Tax=Vibrio harveyi group TaxID=717610 RepID=UPI000C86994C|nr:restriction endonuclease subunit S [Vibrio parahaemolyticus]EJB8690888.1 restriction endonuclease subunit S [Vibrio parahaemolyticus]PMS42341.1 restriction endonuclease subunit S [Vibrio parahaemolyticus]PMS63147.1 restriction endonuclease subunit S [Vibrio parahaemolyticus]PMS69085.1 restriction endonuclease subunit S [Vibrio parahaemolyticus]PMS74035.1 restriction endonuclease subunit S [Vibrio parahaemolyticus]